MTKYHFYITGGEKLRANQAARSHAMRTALGHRSDGLPAGVHPPLQISQTTVRSKRSLKNRFRLQNSKDSVESSARSDLPHYAGTDHVSTHQATDLSRHRPNPREGDRQTIVHTPAGFHVSYVTLQYNQHTNALFECCLNHFQWHVETPGQDKAQLAFSMRDPLIMATVLAMAGIYSALDGTLRDTSVELEAWRQKGLAIQQINRQLQSNYPRITDSIIVSLATLISIMNVNGVFQMASIHLNGLAQMIQIRGGFESLQHNHQLLRAAKRSDIHAAAGLGRRPIFPLFRHGWDLTSPSTTFLDVESDALTQLRSDGAAEDLVSVLLMLRKAILLRNSSLGASPASVDTEGLVDAAEHIILRHIDEPIGEQLNATVVHAMFSAAHIFIYSLFRAIPRGAKIFTILFMRLQQSLQNNAGLPSGGSKAWPGLWALLIGYAVSLRIDGLQNSSQEWFQSQLKTALNTTNQNRQLDKTLLEKHMMEFLWDEGMCRVAFTHIYAGNGFK